MPMSPIHSRRPARYLGVLLILALFNLGLVQPVAAAMVSTPALLSQAQTAQQRAELRDMLQREEVRAQLVSLGVEPDAALARVDVLSAEEVATLHQQMEELPAGGGVAGTIVLILLVLAVTDILGWTDVYSFIN